MSADSTSSTSAVPDRRSVEDHIRRLRGVLEPVVTAREPQTLQLDPHPAGGQGSLVGRVSAARVRAPLALPGFDNSQMDGFALRSADTGPPGVPFSLPLGGVVPAGAAAPDLSPGECAAVMTGAPIPAGADLVIPVEKTAAGFTVLKHVPHGDEVAVQFTAVTEEEAQPGRFIRRRGSDVALGDTLLHQGTVLTPPLLALLAACGIAEVAVLERIRTLVLATGEELRRPGEPLGPGQLYDANTTLIRGVCEGYGHHVSTAVIASDSPETFHAALDELIAQHRPHLMVTAGGISAGAFEVVRQALTDRGVRFGSVAQQPGGPQGWGTLTVGRQPVALVALPGNPVSCAVSLETLLRPALVGLDPGCPPQRRVTVRVGEQLMSPQGVRQFRRVELTTEDGAPTALTVGGPSSHLLGHLARAHALLELHEDDTEIPIGTRREAILL